MLEIIPEGVADNNEEVGRMSPFNPLMVALIPLLKFFAGINVMGRVLWAYAMLESIVASDLEKI